MQMNRTIDFKIWIINIQTTDYHGARTVFVKKIVDSEFVIGENI